MPGRTPAADVLQQYVLERKLIMHAAVAEEVMRLTWGDMLFGSE